MIPPQYNNKQGDRNADWGVEKKQHGEWEKMDKKICATVKTSDEEENEGDGHNDKDYSVLCWKGDANLLDSHSSSKYYCCLTRLVDRSERESCLLLACDLLVLLVAFRWDVSRTCEILQVSILHLCHFSQHTPMVPSFFLRWDQVIYGGLTSTRFEFLAFCRLLYEYSTHQSLFWFSWSWILCGNHSHDLVSELLEQSTL